MKRYLGLGAIVLLAAAGLGYALGQRPPFTWLILVPLAGLVWLGLDSFLATHPHLADYPTEFRIAQGILPTLLIFGAALFQRFVFDGEHPVVVAVLTGVVLALVGLAQYLTLELRSARFGPLRLGLYLVAYGVAFVLYATLFDGEWTGGLRALGVGVVSALLALEVLREPHLRWGATLPYAATIGLVLGQITLVLGYLPVNGLLGGLFLLLLLYALTGITQNQFSGRLTRWTLVEFGMVTLVGFAFLFGSRWPWS